MPRDVLAREAMTTDVVTFAPDEAITDAMQRLVDNNVDAGPVVDADGKVVGMLSTGDLIVQESQLHYPTVISILGGLIELPRDRKHFEEDLSRAVAATVGDAMEDEAVTVGPDDTLETVATLMHDHDVSRVPVVDEEGRLLGLVARGDILRAMMTPRADG
jgi:CBS domain-containing protein